MSRWSAREIGTGVLQTLLRMSPFPTRTGLRRIGNPGPRSPVVLTCNFALTVQLVRHALAGLDAWLLVANSRGVNVWCAATGGVLTDHDVVSVLKTSAIADQVEHRRVILPQLAATGIDGGEIRRQTGWQVVWGPIEAADLAAFLAAGGDRTIEPRTPALRAMRTIAFPLSRRLQMAVAWAFPLSLLAAAILAPLRREALPGAVILIWALALGVFAAFPLYGRWLRPRTGPRRPRRAFDGRQLVLALVLWLVLMAGWIAADALRGALVPAHLWPWGLAALLVAAILCIDLSGSTPVYKSGLLPDRLLAIALDESRCSGAAFCAQVCPKDVLEIDRARQRALLARPADCVQCGACVVQCPFDALSFMAPDGGTLAPAVVREFKLNLMGTRTVRR